MFNLIKDFQINKITKIKQYEKQLRKNIYERDYLAFETASFLASYLKTNFSEILKKLYLRFLYGKF